MNTTRPTAVRTDAAPAPVGPYSQAVAAGQFVFLSGQIGLDPKTGLITPGGVAAETRQVLANLDAVLKAADLTLADVVRTEIFLADLSDFAAVNEIYAAAFTADPLPARHTVESPHLPKGARVEISAVAYRSV